MKIKIINALFFLLCLMLIHTKKFNFNTSIHNHLKKTKYSNLNSIKFNSNLTNNETKKKYISNKLSSFIIEAPESKKTGFINMGLRNYNNTISFGILKNRFTISSNKINHLSTFHNTTNITGNRVIIESISTNDHVSYKNISQWRLIQEDTFREINQTKGWSFNRTTSCSHFYLLGGHCELSKKEISRQLNNLPNHKEVRIEANFHFTGKWDYNAAFMKIMENKADSKYLWTDVCKSREKASKKNQICGYEICKLNSIINVSFSHNKKDLNLVFGTDLSHDLPCETSYAISNFKVYVR